MAARYCPKCGLIISHPEANYCPHCGYDLRKASESPEKVYCIKCGKESPITYRFCPYCGHLLIKPKPPKSPQASETPTSIMAAAILCMIIGSLAIIPTIVGFLAGTFMHNIGLSAATSGLGILGIPAQMAGVFLNFIGGIFATIATLYFIAGYYLLDSKKSGGYLGLILSIIGILASAALWWLITPLQLIAIIINLTILILIAVGWPSLH